jgi:ApaG protein
VLRARRASSRMPDQWRRGFAPLPVSGRSAAASRCVHRFVTGITMAQYEFSVSVETRYLPEQSDPDSRQYAFAYTLTIRNTGEVAAQLISRHWIITDSNDHVQEVKGLGVVGHQPLLPPGEQFEYTSWAVIATPVGTMRGEYFCVAEDGERFEAPVAEFALHMPRTLH